MRIIPDFAGLLRHALIAAHFFAHLRLDLGRHPCLRDRFVQLRDFRRLSIALAQLALNGRHLLTQNGLALALVENGLGLPADFLAQPEDFDPLRKKPRNLVHPERQVDGLEDFLFLFRRDVHIGSREIRQRGSRLRILHRGNQLGRHLRQKFKRLDSLLAQQHGARFDLRSIHHGLRDAQNIRYQ